MKANVTCKIPKIDEYMHVKIPIWIKKFFDVWVSRLICNENMNFPFTIAIIALESYNYKILRAHKQEL